MADLLDMDYINSLPQPFLGRTRLDWWPIHDFEVETGLVRIDVCGKLEVKHIGDFRAFRDGAGVERSPEAFYADANEEERAPIAGVALPAKPLTDRECWEQGKPDSIDRAMAYEAGVLASAPLQPNPPTYWCNKCGYHGTNERHIRPSGTICPYVASPVDGVDASEGQQ